MLHLLQEEVSTRRPGNDSPKGQWAGEEVARLFDRTTTTFRTWTRRLRDEAAGEFPEKVTAFRAGMAAHGRFGQPCSACGSPIQRIVYARNEANYCARCQTGGKLLADRALSRLLKNEWPRTLEDLERLTPSSQVQNRNAEREPKSSFRIPSVAHYSFVIRTSLLHSSLVLRHFFQLPLDLHG